jgi:hypothetical protein
VADVIKIFNKELNKDGKNKDICDKIFINKDSDVEVYIKMIDYGCIVDKFIERISK